MKKVIASVSSIYRAKVFTTGIYRAELESFKSHIKTGSIDKFIQKYISNNQQANVSSKEDVYSLILNSALTLKDSEIINHIFDSKLGNNILVNPDDLGKSPIARVLIYGDESLLDQVKEYIHAQENNTFKSNLPKEDLPNILNALGCSKWEGFTSDRYLDEYIKPLYTESDYQRLVKALGESEA